MTRSERKAMLERLFLVGVERCSPARILPEYLPKDAPEGRTIILGAGKASADMAAVAVENLDGPVSGCVVTRYGHGVERSTGNVDIVEAGHPTPDDNGLAAARKIMALASAASAGDRVLFLISGGGSALLTAPIEGLEFAAKRDISHRLVKSGAPIEHINFVRKHLSKVKGGGLSVAAEPAEQITYLISDVVGDDPAAIASGPTLPMERDPERALALLKEYDCPIDDALAAAIRVTDRPSPAPHETHLLATNGDALDEIEMQLKVEGWDVSNLGAGLQGDAGETGFEHAALVNNALQSKRPLAIISGGELTVRVDKAGGCGGPNLEYLAAMAERATPGAAFSALACDSDGIDGTEDNAGAFIDGDSISRFKQNRLDLPALRRAHRTYDLFNGADDLVITGPTRTNINDIRIILVNGDNYPAA